MPRPKYPPSPGVGVTIAFLALGVNVVAVDMKFSNGNPANVRALLENYTSTSLMLTQSSPTHSFTTPDAENSTSDLSDRFFDPEKLPAVLPLLKTPVATDPIREFSVGIITSFIRTMRKRHVVLLTSEHVLPCQHVARELLVSSEFVSVSCGNRVGTGPQIVVLTSDDIMDNVGETDETAGARCDSNFLKETEETLNEKGKSVAYRGVVNRAATKGMAGGSGRLTRAALAMPPGSTILLLTFCSRIPRLPVHNVHLYQATLLPGGALIREAWTFPDDPRPVVELRGHWTPSEGLWMEPRQHGGPRDFQGRGLRVAMLVDPPYVTEDNSTGRRVLGGYLPSILDMLATGLNFTPIIVSPPDGKFGVELPNGTWNGILGVLHKREAELGLVSFSMHEPRRRIVDYIRPVEWTHYGFMIRDHPNQRGHQSINWRAYTGPFTFDLWVATAALLTCAAAIWTAMESGSPIQTAEEASRPPEPFWTVLGVLVQQGASSTPEPASQRILLGSLWVFSVVLFASFTSNIVSLLASTRYVMPFETLEQLAALTDWKIIANPDSADLSIIRGLPELNGSQTIIKSMFPKGIDVLFTESDATLFTARSNVDHVLRRNCSFIWSAIRVLPSGGFLTGQRDLPYRDAIATRLSHLSEAGLLHRLWERTQQQPTVAGCHRLSQFNTMTLQQTAPALALLGVGLLAAMLVVMVECHWGKRRVQCHPSNKCGKERRRHFTEM